MKKFLLSVLAIAAVTFTTAAQEKTAPRTEYSVSVSENAIQVKPGESKEITLTILRSQSFSKAKAELGLSSSLPEGVTVEFTPSEGLIDSSVVKVTAAAAAKEGGDGPRRGRHGGHRRAAPDAPQSADAMRWTDSDTDGETQKVQRC